MNLEIANTGTTSEHMLIVTENLVRNNDFNFKLSLSIAASKFLYTHYNTKKNWTDAQTVCKDRGGNLISFHSLQEEKAVNIKESAIWIGLRDVVGDNKNWQWSDKTNLSWVNWGQNESNYKTEKCVAMEVSGKWADYLCDREIEFLCKSGRFL